MFKSSNHCVIFKNNVEHGFIPFFYSSIIFSLIFDIPPALPRALRLVCRGTLVENRCFTPCTFEIFASVVRSFCLSVTKILLLE
jgi:hypothetical protein